MVYLKKILGITAALFFSFILTEIFVRITINHPTYNIEKKLYGLRKSNNGITDLYMPHSRFWSSEGGYSISQTNNLGLPGSDVIVSDSSKYIFVLGSSYVQANQVSRSEVSTSVLQSKLGSNSRYQVINLGEGKLDQYDSYFKLKYFEKYYKPDIIFLILERVDDRWLSRHDTLDFSLDENAGREIRPNILDNFEKYIRMRSSLINLLSNGYKIASKIVPRKTNVENKGNNPNLIRKDEISKKLLVCLKKYAEDFSSRIIIVSIIDNSEINTFLRDYCRERNIVFKFNPLNNLENQLKFNGHLNKKGNEELGNFLYEILKEEKYDKFN